MASLWINSGSAVIYTMIVTAVTLLAIGVIKRYQFARRVNKVAG